MIIKSYSTIQEIESIAKSFLPDILAFFETEEGRREFEERREKKNQYKIRQSDSYNASAAFIYCSLK